MNRKLSILAVLVAGVLSWPSEGQTRQSSPTFTKAEWTWVSGSNTVNHPGVYGTQGVAATTNIPGSRQQAVSWIDAKGNFWLFGGYGYDIFSSTGWLNDLWKFDGSKWTWVNGSTTINNWGNYGIRGITNATNMPGGRAQATSWVDSLGNVWIFGGNGQGEQYYRGYLNDLWKFDGTNWTWISGNGGPAQQGMYSTKGTPSPVNSPGSRYGASGWIDSANHLWLFGGIGYDLGGSQGNLNDLWMFDGTNWTWVNGSNTSYNNGHYGTQGVPDPSNSPSGRQDAASWVDDSGIFWLFGGTGYDSAFNIGSLNDLWKFDGVIWTWVAGSPLANQRGVYGTQGTGAAGNYPGARFGAGAWMEKGGVLWLFGGSGYDSFGNQGVLNDLWAWNGSVWTWVNGSSSVNQAGNYGTLGVAAATNVPGARQDASLFMTSGGDLCLFGGQGEDSAGQQGQLNDFWRYRPAIAPNGKPSVPKGVAAAAGHGANELTWDASVGASSYTVSRSTTSGAETILKQGIASLFYVDRGLANGTKYFYKVTASGPTGASAASAEVSATPLATLPVSPTLSATTGPGSVVLTWTATGTSYQVSRSLSPTGPFVALGASTANATLTDSGVVNGSTYYYVVVATNATGHSVYSNSVSATPSGPAPTESWTWMSGASQDAQAGSYGTKGVASPANFPGSRSAAASWTDFSGNFWIFGGGGFDSNGTNGPMSDLWKFDGTNWTWVSGPNVGLVSGVYGTQGKAAATNMPGARTRAASWIDHSGNLWLFGGYGLDTSYIQGELNDLWKFDGTNWTWVKGANVINSAGVYGTEGVGRAANTPGGRDAAAYAVDAAGDFWLFGGESTTSNNSWNDLWKFDGKNWIWVSGSNTTQQLGVYGTKGVGAAGNTPGARSQGAAWKDASGNFWLFGGYGVVGPNEADVMNDLWKYDGTNWTWMSGPQNIGAPDGVYGTQGIASPSNTPGARFGMTSWIDSSNHLWMFGGGGHDLGVALGSLNDLWMFDGTNWAWMGGSDTVWEIGTYGVKGTAAAVNSPGARNGAVPFIDLSGRLWLFGGGGLDGTGNTGTLNDLWRFGP